MIRPEIREETFNEVRLLSESTTGSFEDSLLILVEKYKKLLKELKKNQIKNTGGLFF